MATRQPQKTQTTQTTQTAEHTEHTEQAARTTEQAAQKTGRAAEPTTADGQPPTTLDSDLTRPQITQPGDAPADTTDPTERASSAEPDKGAAAAAGFGTVNAVVPLPQPEPPADDDADEGRTESYEAVGPDGKRVKVTRNIETGESKASSA